jgi:diguanylate cyclase (GGDEF)-like protein
MSRASPNTRRPSPGLGTQLAALSLLVLTVTLAAGGYAAWTVEQLRDLAARHAALDDLALAELSIDHLNESLRADVIARYATLSVDDSMLMDLQDLQGAALSLRNYPEEDVRTLASDEYTFAATAQRLLAGPRPTGSELARFQELSHHLSQHLSAGRAALDTRTEEEVRARDGFTLAAVRRLSLVAVGMALLLFTVSWLIRRRLLAALRQLASAARAVAAGDLSARTGRAGRDEVGQLASVLDDTSDTLQRAFAEREADARRQAFRARLDRALAQVDEDQGLAETIGRALDQVAPNRSAELLIADSSEAHLHPFATNPRVPAPGCRVSTPWSCPAVRGGRVAEFTSAEELDACPHLRNRPEGDRSGVCIPVSFMGRVLGVLHSAAEPQNLPDADTMYQLKVLSEQTGARVGNLRAFDQVQRQAAMDSLTGLPNRRSFEDAVHKLAARNLTYGVLLADLDHFKAVNDTYGHAAGDRALRLFADVLRSALRDKDIPCRFGGEEFAIVIADVDAPGAADVADRLRIALAIAVPDNGPAFTVSIGVSDSTMASDLAGQLALADAALMAAKREGRDRCLMASPHGSPSHAFPLTPERLPADPGAPSR